MTLKAKKEFGQHWLHDGQSLEAMVKMAEVEEGDMVLEVGPGLGTLTEHLLARGAHVMAVEIDQELYRRLEEEAYSRYSNDAQRLVMINENILKFDLTQLPPDYKVVANIPYYLTSNLIRILAESANRPASITLLVQKEVAERLAAKPGSMSLLGVTTQMYFDPSLGKVVPAELFSPPPKVDSQIIHLQRRSEPLYGELDSKHLFRVVKAGFSNRRKTLLNSLSAGLHLSKEETKKKLEEVKIDHSQRPQNLSLEEWIQLSTVA